MRTRVGSPQFRRRDGGGLHCPFYCAVIPPSTGIAHPVTNDAASESSHATASAISAGLPIRDTGSTATSRSLIRGFVETKLWTIAVSITPGHTQLIRIFARAYSRAPVFVSPTTPCLDAVYAGIPCEPTSPAADAVLTIAPPPCFIICRISYFMQSHTPRRFTAIMRSKFSSVSSATRAILPPIPALLRHNRAAPRF